MLVFLYLLCCSTHFHISYFDAEYTQHYNSRLIEEELRKDAYLQIVCDIGSNYNLYSYTLISSN